MKKIISIDELQKCACFNLRLMARELTNEYNNSLKLTGINSTQIPILAILNIHDKLETPKIARMLNLEISTVRRNLSILQKKKYIKIIKKDIHGNHLALTNQGFMKLRETLPFWRNSQKIGKRKTENYLEVLKKIIK